MKTNEDNNLEIELTKVNAKLDEAIKSMSLMTPGVAFSMTEFQKLQGLVLEAKALNAIAMNRLHLVSAKPALKWEGGDLAMDEGAILEVPAHTHEEPKVVKSKKKPAVTTDLSQIVPSFKPKARSQGVISENVEDES